MSRNPPGLGYAAHELPAMPGKTLGPPSNSPFSRPLADYVPLSARPSHELRARSAELSSMAATARTAEAKVALEILASRFAVMAARRKAAEALNPVYVDADEA